MMAAMGAIAGLGAVAVAGAVVAWQSWATPDLTPVALSKDDSNDSDSDSDLEVEDDTWYDNGTMKCKTECMIITSNGEETPTGTNIAKKRVDPNRRRKATAFLPGIKDDLRRVKEMVERDPNKTVMKVLEDKPGSQRPRDYYYVQIADFLQDCDEPGGIYYSYQCVFLLLMCLLYMHNIIHIIIIMVNIYSRVVVVIKLKLCKIYYFAAV